MTCTERAPPVRFRSGSPWGNTPPPVNQAGSRGNMSPLSAHNSRNKATTATRLPLLSLADYQAREEKAARASQSD